MKTTSFSRSSVPSPHSATTFVRHRLFQSHNARRWLATAALATALTGTLPAQIPQVLNYQGRVAVNNVNFNGPGLFRFALVNAGASTTYWRNAPDDTPADGLPDAAVSLTVTKGLYSVLLGDTMLQNMAAMPATVFNYPDVRLRVWFDDGTNGLQLLTPDQRIAAVGYAMMAGNVPDGTITGAKIAAATVNAANIAAGAVGTAQLATGAVEGGNIAAGAVGTAQMADYAITSSKLRPGYLAGTLTDGTLDVAPGVFVFSASFACPFSVVPAVSLLTPGWALGPVSTDGFTATLSYPPQTIRGNLPILPPAPGRYTSLAVVAAAIGGGGGLPAVSYYDGNRTLKYVRAADPRGTMWDEPGQITVDNTVTAGQYSSLAVVAGNPAIAYHVADSADLNYVSTTDPLGMFWNPPVTLDALDNVGQFVALAEVAGYPAISYYDTTNTALKFIRAKDPMGTAWETPLTLDSDGSVGTYGSLAVINGNPAISYYDATNGDLKYIRATDAAGTNWNPPLTVDTGDTDNVGTYTSLTVADGNPAISYYDTSNGDLKYIRATDANGAAWGTPLTPDSTGSVGAYAALQVVNGSPAISYFDATNGALKYVHASDAGGTVWDSPMILDNTGMTGTHTSLAVVDGVPAVTYYEQFPAPAKYKFAVVPDSVPELAWRASDGSVAPITAATVTTGAIGPAQLAANAVQSANIAGGAVGSTQLAADAVTAAKIAPGAITSTQLAKPPRSGTIASSSLDIQFNQAAFTVAFSPAFGTTPIITLGVRSASGTPWQPAVWTTSTTAGSFSGHFAVPAAPVVPDSYGGPFASLAVVDGNPAVAYFDTINSDLKFIRARDVNGTVWGAPVILDNTGIVGYLAELAVVNGNPAVAYLDLTNSDLKFIRATDASGTVWGTPAIIDSESGFTSNGTISLAVINGNPALAYYDPVNDDLKFARATDGNGTAWGTPAILDSEGDVGTHASLAVVNGNPAVAYRDQTNKHLKFVRATNPDGTAWVTPATLDSNENVGGYASLAVVDGNPAIAYCDFTNDDLLFVRASDAPGTVWGTPAVLDSAGSVGAHASLAVVDGRPAVAYREFVQSDLKYVRATNASGTAWGTPITLDSVGSVGYSASLTAVSGNPAIAYFDSTNTDLKFVRPELPASFSIDWIAIEP